MAANPSTTFTKYSTIIGAMLVIFVDGLYWYWGNLAVYTFSFYVLVNDATSSVNTPWIISIFLIFWTAGNSISGSISQRSGRRYTILLGIFLTSLGIFSCYFAVQSSILALNVSIGLIVGIGTGLTDSSALQLVLEWTDKDAGLVTSVVQSSMPLGGFLINQLITLYTNPHNLSPDWTFDHQMYFTQTEILQRVPSLFLLIGCVSLGTKLVGFFMLRRKEDDDIHPNQKCLPALAEIHTEGEEKRELVHNNYNSNSHTYCEITKTASQISDKFGETDYNPQALLTMPSFYAFWVTSFLGDMSVVVLTNYYKLFGQLWIQDDHFLTAIGTTYVLASAGASFLWGMAIDSYGVKGCFLVVGASSTFVQAWYYLGPMTHRWLYAVETTLLGCFGGALISCYATAIALVYGKEHFTNNFGLFLTSTLAFNAIAPFLLEGIIDSLGWFSLWTITTICSGVRLVLFMLFIPGE